jgi:enoyl-CoA hydratase
MPDAVLTKVHERLLVITLNRPEAGNAINAEMVEGLLEGMDRLERDDGLAVAVLTGAGHGFSTGVDLCGFPSGTASTCFAEFIEQESTKPLVAAVEGFAVAAGLEIVLRCDVLVAARGAKLGLPEVATGLFAGAHGLSRLPHRLPYGVAMEMALTGEPITAEQAHHYGFVSRLTEPGGALGAAIELAGRIARNDSLAVTASKRRVADSQALTAAEFWELQRINAMASFSMDAKGRPGPSGKERPPAWTGR